MSSLIEFREWFSVKANSFDLILGPCRVWVRQINGLPSSQFASSRLPLSQQICANRKNKTLSLNVTVAVDFPLIYIYSEPHRVALTCSIYTTSLMDAKWDLCGDVKQFCYRMKMEYAIELAQVLLMDFLSVISITRSL